MECKNIDKSIFLRYAPWITVFDWYRCLCRFPLMHICSCLLSIYSDSIVKMVILFNRSISLIYSRSSRQHLIISVLSFFPSQNSRGQLDQNKEHNIRASNFSSDKAQCFVIAASFCNCCCSKQFPFLEEKSSNHKQRS